MKPFPPLLLLFLLISAGCFSQVCISNNGSSAGLSAALEIRTPDKGLLPPRVSLSGASQATPVTNPAAGLLVFNTDSAGSAPDNVIPGYYYWNGIKWIPLFSADGETNGNMMYWSENQWNVVPVGAEGQRLQISQQGIPVWSGPTLAEVTTSPVTSITQSTATSGGSITNDGDSQVTARGVCYGTGFNPDISGNHTLDGFGSLPFTSYLSGLQPGTRYYVRAYATNGIGTSYGQQVTFLTSGSPPPQPPLRPTGRVTAGQATR